MNPLADFGPAPKRDTGRIAELQDDSNRVIIMGSGILLDPAELTDLDEMARRIDYIMYNWVVKKQLDDMEYDVYYLLVNSVLNNASHLIDLVGSRGYDKEEDSARTSLLQRWHKLSKELMYVMRREVDRLTGIEPAPTSCKDCKFSTEQCSSDGGYTYD